MATLLVDDGIRHRGATSTDTFPTMPNTLRTISTDRGDTSPTVQWGVDAPIQLFATALSGNRTVTLSTTGAVNGAWFRIVRTGLGALTLDVGGLKTIASLTAGWVEVGYNGSAWVLTAYGLL